MKGEVLASPDAKAPPPAAARAALGASRGARTLTGACRRPSAGIGTAAWAVLAPPVKAAAGTTVAAARFAKGCLVTASGAVAARPNPPPTNGSSVAAATLAALTARI